MFRQKILFVFILMIISIVAERERKKTCIHNLVINGTNLITGHRKQLIVVGMINFNNLASRIQADRYNDLFRELKRHGITDSVAHLFLINEQLAARDYPGDIYDQIRLFQDNPTDRLGKKLRSRQQSLTNYVFGRCGFLIFTQSAPYSDLNDEKNYQELLRVITTAVKNKRSCRGLCS